MTIFFYLYDADRIMFLDPLELCRCVAILTTILDNKISNPHEKPEV